MSIRFAEKLMVKDAVPTFKSGFGRAVLWSVLLALFLYAYQPVLVDLIRSWIASDDNSHGFLVIPIALYLAWRNRDTLSASISSGSFAGLAISFLSLAAYLFALAGEIKTLASLSLITFIGGAIIFLFGYATFRKLLFPLFILVFMVPVPAQIQAFLTVPLQLFVSKAAVWLSNLAGIPIYREGNVIFHPMGTFEVVQACSGLRSLTALLLLGVLFAYLALRSNLLRTALFVSAVPIAILVNILRVFIMVATLNYLGLRLTHGAPHMVLGIFLFLLAVGLFFLLQQVLAKWER
jgi:exosortase A